MQALFHAPAAESAIFAAESAPLTPFPLDAAQAVAYNGSMLKALGIFVRLVCSLVVLFAVALYLQMPVHPLSMGVAPEQFVDGVTLDAVKSFFTSLNWVSITAGVLVLCALLRLLDMAWNVAFCLSIVLVLFCGLWTIWGPVVALPAPVQGNGYMIQLCTLPQDYPVPAVIVMGVFAMGWLASTAPFRIAFTTLVSFGLWYGITCLMHWGIVTRWADTPTPAQPELLAMVLANPWMIAALPGAFFLVYAVLVAFFETFLSPAKKKEAPRAEEKPADAPEKEEPVKPAAGGNTPAAPVRTAAKVVKPVLKPAAKPAPAAKAAPKTEEAPTPKEAPKPEPTPQETPASPAPEPKPEPTPQETPASPAPEPKPEAKPAEQPSAVEAKPEPETKPAEAAAPAAEKSDAKPAPSPEEKA